VWGYQVLFREQGQSADGVVGTGKAGLMLGGGGGWRVRGGGENRGGRAGAALGGPLCLAGIVLPRAVDSDGWGGYGSFFFFFL
jgi:hypothetical protein